MTDEPTGVRVCGRPTKCGRPCRAQVYGSGVACGLHTTDHEREVAEAYRRGHADGWERGLKAKGDSEKMRVEWLDRRVRELEQRVDDAERYHQIDGGCRGS